MPTRPSDCRIGARNSAPKASACAGPSICSSTPSRITAVRQMILADDEAGRRAALAKLLPEQRGDFVEIFADHGRAAGDDPPARSAAARIPAARATRSSPTSPTAAGVDVGHAASAARANCTNSTRCWAIAAAGWASPSRKSTRCRRARFSRRRAMSRRGGRCADAGSDDPAGRDQARAGHPEGAGRSRWRQRCSPRQGRRVDYLVGTMIELPRAALMAGEIAEDSRVLQLRHQ